MTPKNFTIIFFLLLICQLVMPSLAVNPSVDKGSVPSTSVQPTSSTPFLEVYCGTDQSAYVSITGFTSSNCALWRLSDAGVYKVASTYSSCPAAVAIGVTVNNGYKMAGVLQNGVYYAVKPIGADAPVIPSAPSVVIIQSDIYAPVTVEFTASSSGATQYNFGLYDSSEQLIGGTTSDTDGVWVSDTLGAGSYTISVTAQNAAGTSESTQTDFTVDAEPTHTPTETPTPTPTITIPTPSRTQTQIIPVTTKNFTVSTISTIAPLEWNKTAERENMTVIIGDLLNPYFNTVDSFSSDVESTISSLLSLTNWMMEAVIDLLDPIVTMISDIIAECVQWASVPLQLMRLALDNTPAGIQALLIYGVSLEFCIYLLRGET